MAKDQLKKKRSSKEPIVSFSEQEEKEKDERRK